MEYNKKLNFQFNDCNSVTVGNKNMNNNRSLNNYDNCDTNKLNKKISN